MDIKPTGSKIVLQRVCYLGLKIKKFGHCTTANGQGSSFLRNNFSGLTPALLRLIHWKDPTIAEKVKPADEGLVKVPTIILNFGLQQVKPNDRVTLLNMNDYLGVIPSTFDQLQDVMNECFSLREKNGIRKFGDGILHYTVSDHIAKERGVLVWLDEFNDDPGHISVAFRVQLFRGSTLDWLDMYLPLKSIKIIDYFQTQDVFKDLAKGK